MHEAVRFVPLEERKAYSPSSYININGKDTNPDAWPIQVRNGIISVDFGVGCLGCAWCIAKRQGGRDIMQNMPYKNQLSAENILSLLQQTKAFTQAKLPLRIGNNTDGTLIPVKELDIFYKAIPKDVPIVLLTRGTHSSELNKFLAKTGKNFVLSRSITPPHKNLEYQISWDKAFRGFKEASCQKVLNIGPLAQEAFEDTIAILRSGQISPDTRISIVPLNRRLIPDHVLATVTAQPITREQMEELERTAREKGLIVYRANNCAIAELNDKTSLEYGDINSDINYRNQFKSDTIGTSNNRGLESTCPHCANYGRCKNHFQDRLIKIEELHEMTSLLGVPEAHLIFQTSGLIVIDAPGITKSETSYLSGMLETRVTGINSLAQPNQQAVERWIESDFYPVEEVATISERFDPLRFAKSTSSVKK